MVATSGTARQLITRRSLLHAGTAGVVGVAATATLAACGGQQPTPSSAPATLRYACWGDQATVMGVEQKMVDAFTARNPKITVAPIELTANTNEHYNKLITQLAGGTPPDQAMVNILLFPTFYSQNALLDLTPYVQKTKRKLEDYWPSQMNGFKYEGKVWGFGHDFSPRLMFVNKTMLSRAGQTIDEQKWTWDDFVRIAKAMTRSDDDPKAWGTHAGDYLNWLYSAGGSVYNADGTKVTMDTPQAVRGLEYQVDLVSKHRVTPLAAERGGRAELQLFIDGQIGMFMTGRWQYPRFTPAASLDWDVVLPPVGPGGRWTNGGGAGFSILKPGKQADAAWELLAWMSGDGQKEVADVIGIPSYKPATQAPKFKVTKPANDKVFIDLAEKYTKLQPLHPKQNDIDRLIADELGKAQSGQKPVVDAARAIAEQGTAIVQGFPWKQGL